MTLTGQKFQPAILGETVAKWRRRAVTTATVAALLPLIAVAMPGQASATRAVEQPVTQVVNAVSGVPVIVDGQFSAGVAGTPEWSDVTPLAFISGNPGPKVTSRTDPLADSFVYTGLAPGLAVGDGNALYLMYDYHSRTNPFVAGDTIASISFPIHLAPPAFTESLVTVGLALADTQTLVTVEFGQSANPGNFACHSDLGISASQTCTVIKPDGTRLSAFSLGLFGAVGFGKSLERPGDPAHLLVELEVPVLVPAATPIFPNANAGVYSPDPKFWGASATDNAGDPPISSSIVNIDPVSGQTTTTFAPVPEPTTIVLLGMGLLGLGMVSRRRG